MRRAAGSRARPEDEGVALVAAPEAVLGEIERASGNHFAPGLPPSPAPWSPSSRRSRRSSPRLRSRTPRGGPPSTGRTPGSCGLRGGTCARCGARTASAARSRPPPRTATRWARCRRPSSAPAALTSPAPLFLPLPWAWSWRHYRRRQTLASQGCCSRGSPGGR